MKIALQLTAEDYLRARRLAMRPRPLLRYIGWGMVVLFSAYIVWLGYEAFTGARSQFPFWLALGIVAYLLALYYIAIPWGARRNFRQQKTLQKPVELEFTDSHFLGSSPHGTFNIPWSDFHKWKKNEHMILAYQSAVLMNMIPLRFFQSPDDINKLVATLEANLGPQKP